MLLTGRHPETHPYAALVATAPTSLRRLNGARVFAEFVRTPVLLVVYLVLSMSGRWFLAVPAAIACFFAAFVLLHDTMHNAFRLPRATNEVLLALVGLVLLKSGHGLRATHLRHHSRTLEHNDPEGGVVHWPLWRVVLVGPFHVLGNRTLSLRLSPRTRRNQMLETALTVVVIAAAIALFAVTGSVVGLVYWAVVAVFSATMSVWAAYLPHMLSPRHPLVRTAALWSRWWTPMLSSLAFHDLHHQYPRVPTAQLSELAKTVGPEVAFFDHGVR